MTTSNGLVVETFRSGGPGGQHQNKTESGVRIRHLPSGAVGESREHRSQYQNKRAALKRMASTHQFRYWVSLEAKRIEGFESAEKWVERQMAELANFKLEIKDENGLWKTITWDEL